EREAVLAARRDLDALPRRRARVRRVRPLVRPRRAVRVRQPAAGGGRHGDEERRAGEGEQESGSAHALRVRRTSRGRLRVFGGCTAAGPSTVAGVELGVTTVSRLRLLPLADALGILTFATVGLLSHDHALSLSGYARDALPVLGGWFAAALVFGAYRSPST